MNSVADFAKKKKDKDNLTERKLRMARASIIVRRGLEGLNSISVLEGGNLACDIEYHLVYKDQITSLTPIDYSRLPETYLNEYQSQFIHLKYPHRRFHATQHLCYQGP